MHFDLDVYLYHWHSDRFFATGYGNQFILRINTSSPICSFFKFLEFLVDFLINSETFYLWYLIRFIYLSL